MIQLTCITVKFQRCGKINCRCSNGYLHGPYFWLIIYKKPTRSKKGKYNWIYLGKDNSNINNKLKSLTFTKNWDHHQWSALDNKIKKLKSNTKNKEKYNIELPK
jgi:uncharacterized protein YlbG (UPF0298 family)